MFYYIYSTYRKSGGIQKSFWAGDNLIKMTNVHEKFMGLAIEEARRGAAEGEVPVGAVLVMNGEVIARGHNLREGLSDPTAHAEMLVLREASQRLDRWRLTDATLYVTMEPCAMCAGAAVLARISRVVYGCSDPKAGACGSVVDITREPQLNHQIEVVPGILKEACQSVLKEFFLNRRTEKLSI
jgi:tRNA(adenine34) deaminase